MATAFSGSSRLANFRQKRNSGLEDAGNNEPSLKLTLPQQEDKGGYEPSSTFNNTRNSMRLLKGKIERKQSTDLIEIKSNILAETQNVTQKISVYQPKQDLKLVINDEPVYGDKKTAEEVPSKPTQKRIMIAKQPSKDESVKQIPVKQQQPKNKKPEPPKEQPKKQKPQQPVNPHDQKPIIKEEDVEESKEQPENENDLVECPEGCGRKFNRKALQKHAKACKVVFMSKRKQFNSEAKRITSKEQANLVKQTKKKEKQFGTTKSSIDKNNDNWRATSQNFRAAIKGIKKEDDKEETEQDNENEKQDILTTVSCEFCEKLFAPILLDKHIQTCAKKKEKEKKKGGAAIKKK